MPTYVMLANWTDQGVRSIGESPKRVDAAKKRAEDAAAKVAALKSGQPKKRKK